MLLVPTAPTHYTIAAMQADPVALNRNLGAYTNFVNLLDYAAISVPGSLRADGLPFGITLIGRAGSDLQLAELGQRYHHATGLTLGATGEAAARDRAVAAARRPPPTRAGRGGRRAPVGHAAQRPADRARRHAGRHRPHRARLPPLSPCPAPCRPSPGCCAWRPARARASRSRSGTCRSPHYGSFVALIPAAARHRHAGAGRRQQRAGLRLRGAGDRTAPTTSRTRRLARLP